MWKMKSTLARIAFRTSIVYWLIASLWILFSDRAVLMISSDALTIGRLSMYKGWAFVFVTAVLLYVMLRGQLSQVEKEAAARREAERELRENEELYHTLIDTLPDAVTV